MRSTAVDLLTVTDGVDAVGNSTKVTTSRTVFAEIGSVSSNEFYQAAQVGLKPEYLVRVFFADYEGEELVELEDGTQMSVYRTYRDDRTERVELYLTKRKTTYSPPPPTPPVTRG